MRDRSWRRCQRERAIQKVVFQFKKQPGWLYFNSCSVPVPHLFWEREEYINTYPAIDHWIPPKTWADVFAARRKEALLRHKNRKKHSGNCCGNPRRWWKERTLKEKIANIDEQEQREELYV